MRTFLGSLALLGCFLCPAVAMATPVDLGGAYKYTVLGAGPTTSPPISFSAGVLKLGSEAHVFGNAGGRGQVDLSSGVIIDDDLDGGSINAGAGVVIGNQSTLSQTVWESIYSDLEAASSAAAALPGGVTLTQILGSKTLNTGSSNPSVYNVAGSITLGSADTLKIQGGASDQIVINVGGGMSLGSGARITLDGVQADNVLFNFTGGGFTYLVDIGAANFQGNYIGPRMLFKVGDGATMEATRILGSGFEGNIQDITPPLLVPEPSTLVLVQLSLTAWALARRRQARS